MSEKKEDRNRVTPIGSCETAEVTEVTRQPLAFRWRPAGRFGVNTFIAPPVLQVCWGQKFWKSEGGVKTEAGMREVWEDVPQMEAGTEEETPETLHSQLNMLTPGERNQLEAIRKNNAKAKVDAEEFISSLRSGDTIENKDSGCRYTVIYNNGEKVFASRTLPITNADEWEKIEKI
jgi:hypothetical protein